MFFLFEAKKKISPNFSFSKLAQLFTVLFLAEEI